MHLFAGSGGGLLGDIIIGHKPICAVEWDKYACSVLRARVEDGWFHDMQVYEGDVRMFDPSEYKGRVDCIHAGFPCQDISVAGKQAGVGEDTRSGLYREVLRIADVVRPRELFMENVSAILSNGLGTVLADLSARGYSARWICLRASDVGANHHRDRWWLLARRSDVSPHAEHGGAGRGEQFEESVSETSGNIRDTEHAGQPTAEITGSIAQGSDDNATRPQQAVESARSGEQYGNVAYPDSEDGRAGCMESNARTDGRDELSGSGSVFPDTTSIGQSGSRTHEQSINHQTSENRQADRSVNICEAGQNIRKPEPSMGGVDDGLADESYINWWGREPDVGRITEDNKNRVAQLKSLGNGQVPLQCAIARMILEELFT